MWKQYLSTQARELLALKLHEASVRKDNNSWWLDDNGHRSRASLPGSQVRKVLGRNWGPQRITVPSSSTLFFTTLPAPLGCERQTERQTPGNQTPEVEKLHPWAPWKQPAVTTTKTNISSTSKCVYKISMYKHTCAVQFSAILLGRSFLNFTEWNSFHWHLVKYLTKARPADCLLQTVKEREFFSETPLNKMSYRHNICHFIGYELINKNVVKSIDLVCCFVSELYKSVLFTLTTCQLG